MVIPQEILHNFIKFSEDNPQTLLNLCLVSRRFVGEAQRVLYRSIRISKSSSAQHSSSSNVVAIATKLFTTFTQHNPSLAKYVQSFYYQSPLPFLDLKYRDLTNKSFQLMTNLKSLTIFAKISPYFFQGCTFQLKKLIFPALGPDHAYRESIYHFLSSQPHLKTLYVDMGHDRLPVKRCDKLETLCGGQRTIENILPGRPTITCLVWFANHGDDLASLLSRASGELSNIHTLALGGNTPYPPLSLWAPYMRSLRVLRLLGRPQINLNNGVRDELERLSDLVNLRTFVWSARMLGRVDHEYNRSMVDQERQRNLVTKWFGEMRVLEVAYFQIATREIQSENYLRWRRNEVDPVPVDFHEAIAQHGLAPWLSK